MPASPASAPACGAGESPLLPLRLRRRLRLLLDWPIPCGIRWPFSSNSYPPGAPRLSFSDWSAICDATCTGTSDTFCSALMLPLPLASCLPISIPTSTGARLAFLVSIRLRRRLAREPHAGPESNELETGQLQFLSSSAQAGLRTLRLSHPCSVLVLMDFFPGETSNGSLG